MQFFKRSEFLCKCERGKKCDAIQMTFETMKMVDQLRFHYGKPLIITSAERCEVQNQKVGGSDNSYHLIGCAVDIKVKDGAMAGRLVKIAIEVGFSGIGVSKHGFIHLDSRPGNLVVFGY
jgi:uncharacterized protein YcbK (DUF882 family)